MTGIYSESRVPSVMLEHLKASSVEWGSSHNWTSTAVTRPTSLKHFSLNVLQPCNNNFCSNWSVVDDFLHCLSFVIYNPGSLVCFNGFEVGYRFS